MFGFIIFGFFTLLHLVLSLASLTLLGAVPLAAFCFFVVEAVTAFDNAVTIAGKGAGISPFTERLNRLRFLLHAICISLLLPVYSEIGRAFGFSASGAELADIIVWVLVLAIGLLGYFYQYRGTGHIMPVNYLGCLRYAQSVDELTRYPGYEYSAEELAAQGRPPVASVLTVLIGLVLAAMIAWLGSFWVPLVVTLIMFLAAAFPKRGWAPLATSCLEVVFSSGMFYALWRAAEVSGG